MRQRWLEATAVEAQAADALERHVRWRVHSSFAHALNLVAADGTWVSVVVTRLAGPWRLLLAPCSLALSSLAPAGTAALRDGTRSLLLAGPAGPLRIAWDQARRFTVRRLRAGSSAGAPALRTHLPRAARRLAAACRAAGGRSERRVWSLAAALARTLRTSAPDSTRAAALVGAGDGLTPAGDDVLTGLLAALQGLPGANSARARRARYAVEAAVGRNLDRTTAVARQQLALALEGLHCEGVAGVLRALERRPEGAAQACRPLAAATSTLLGLGASSGRALLLGVVLGGSLLVRETRRSESGGSPAPSAQHTPEGEVG